MLHKAQAEVMATAHHERPSAPSEPADARAAALLVAARDVFARKGFERTSMQDLARAAGMSAGNFYRYFPSKDAIVEALVGRDMALIEAVFVEIMRAEDSRAALMAQLFEQLAAEDRTEAAIWCEILAAAQRKPAIRAMYVRLQERVVESLLTIFARIRAIPVATARQRYLAHAQLILLLVQGVRLGADPSPLPGDQAGLQNLVRHTLTALLDEVVQTPGAIPASKVGCSA